MKRYISTFIFLCACVAAVYATDVRSWNEGALKWSDFHGAPGVMGSSSAFRAYIEIVPADTVVNGVHKIKLEAVARMDRNMSFATKEAQTPELLKLYQGEYDLLESYRRDLQRELNEGLSGNAAQKRVEYYNSLYREKVQNMYDSTDYGTNSEATDKWIAEVNERLHAQEVPSHTYARPSNFTYGLYLGAGLNVTTGSIHNSFGNTCAFSAGALLGYHRFKLKVDITYAQPKITNMNIMNVAEQETTDTYASYLAISPTLGFTVYDSDKFSITPFVGCSWTRYGWNVANYTYKENKDTGETERVIDYYGSPSLSNFNWRASVDFEYRFKKIYSQGTGTLKGERERIVYSVRLSPYITRGVYKNASPGLNGYQVGFTASIAFVANTLGF